MMLTEEIVQPNSIILDNTDANYTDNWPLSIVAAGYQGNNYQYHAKGTGNNTATWATTEANDEYYDVYVNWTAHPNRATNAKYTINHQNGSDTITVNQQQNGGQWSLLGAYSLNSSNSITLSDDANGYVIADAITLLPAGTTPELDDAVEGVTEQATW